ncbi:MAG: hypothetical protein RMJ56_12675 [Gemmataceae bacterium]|nr:hypothetical protein [Gemmata sp.]MDW8198448.1 hypothetical protein [Gemmataceae bacterium]
MPVTPPTSLPAEATAPSGSDLIPDPEHDPHTPPIAGLPVSVLLGLALLPFGIPVLWWAAPFLTGQKAALSLAVPICLSFAASALCMGVVYTIDWTATTRIKGVLMLVGLAYLAAAGLYFLKKDLMDRVRALFTDDPWHVVFSEKGRFKVRMPGLIETHTDSPLPQLNWRIDDGRRATYQTELDDEYVYLAKAATPAAPAPGDDAWFDAIGQQLAQWGRLSEPRDVTLWANDQRGREWTVHLNNNIVRVVRVYVSDGRVYYLSVEGRHLTASDPTFVEPFFRSFEIMKVHPNP